MAPACEDPLTRQLGFRLRGAWLSSSEREWEQAQCWGGRAGVTCCLDQQTLSGTEKRQNDKGVSKPYSWRDRGTVLGSTQRAVLWGKELGGGTPAWGLQEEGRGWWCA